MGILCDFQTHCRLQRLLVAVMLLTLSGFLYKIMDFHLHKTKALAHPDVTSTRLKVVKPKKLEYDSCYIPSGKLRLFQLEILPGKSPSNLKGDALRITTNTGFQAEIALDRPKVFLEFPFTSFSATLNVSTGPDVIDVTTLRFNTRIMNCSLGIGSNQFPIKLWKSKTELKLVITVHFTRLERPITYDVKSEVEECYLEQDCNVIIYPERKCGPQAMENWRPSAGIQGYWQLKCNDCSQSQTCLWPQAKWVESNGEVTPPTLPDGDHLRACFQNHQLFFVGDSTLRGIMQTMMEKVNRTLDHSLGSVSSSNYTNVGLGANFSLVYSNPYVIRDTATFNFRLNELPTIFPIKGKEEKTILLVGGTQWMRKSHLDDLNKFITKAGISSKNVFVKLFTSGFHITGSGTDRNYAVPPQILVKQNDEVREAAIKYGFGFVDPLQLTLSRYTEFRYGPCACHFHAAIKYKETLKYNKTSKQAPLKNPRTLYHIIGDLDIAYTHMLLKKMCPQN